MAFIGNTSTTQAFTPAVDYFNGNGSSVAFTLSRPVASVAQVQVVIENVPQNPSSAYTVSGNTITFTSAPPSGTSNIYVEYTSPITQVIQPGQGTVSTAQLGNINNINSLTSLALQTNNGVTALSIDASQNVTLAKGLTVGAATSGTMAPQFNQIYPVGSVYIAVVPTNPATLFGIGTWVAFGAGRVMVGLDATQTEFDVVEEVGGAKTHTLSTAEIPAHTHNQANQIGSNAGGNIASGGTGKTDTAPSQATSSTGGGGAHNNLQPYIVCYFWKRTA